MSQIVILLLLLRIVAAHAASPASEIQWVTQQAITPSFYFSVGFEKHDADSITAEILQVKERRTGKVVQELFLQSAPSWNDLNRFVEVLDVNFDNHPDFTIPYADGGAGPNYTMSFYIYDPMLKLFIRNSDLSDLPQPVVNKNGTIKSSSRGGCCQHSSETYRFIAGKLTLVADWDESYTADGKWIITTHRVRHHGKWIIKTTKRKQPSIQ